MKPFPIITLIAAIALPLAACSQDVQRVQVPSTTDPNAYVPQPLPKPLPPEYGGPAVQPQPGPPNAAPEVPQPPQPPLPPLPPTAMVPAPNAAQIASAGNALPEEEAFVRAYTGRRSPRIMVFVNRTIQGDILPKDNLDELIRMEVKHTATGGVKVSSENSASTQANSSGSSAGYSGTSVNSANINSAKTDKSNFVSGGPADYTKTTSLKVVADKLDEIGASRTDYDMVELSLIDYLDCGGRVHVFDSESVRGKLDREKILRIENSDPAAVKLLSTELQTDVLIQVKATPTHQSQWPNGAVRLTVRALSTTDGRNLAAAFVDMPLPMTKDAVNIFTRYLAQKVMTKLTAVWSGNPLWDPLEVRVYKANGVDDTLAIRNFIKKIPGVVTVNTRGATGGSTTSYATLSVAYNGAPEEFYADLKESLKQSHGLKAVDLQSNMVNVEVTGNLELKVTEKAPAPTAAP